MEGSYFFQPRENAYEIHTQSHHSEIHPWPSLSSWGIPLSLIPPREEEAYPKGLCVTDPQLW